MLQFEILGWLLVLHQIISEQIHRYSLLIYINIIMFVQSISGTTGPYSNMYYFTYGKLYNH